MTASVNADIIMLIFLVGNALFTITEIDLSSYFIVSGLISSDNLEFKWMHPRSISKGMNMAA